MSNKTILVATLAAALVSGPAFAGPKYNYIEGGFARIDLDGGPTLDGPSVAGSFAITDNFHVTGEFNMGSGSGVRLDLFTVAAGYNHSFSDNADFVARLGWYNSRVKTNPLPSVTDDGFMAQIGIRGQLTPAFELNGFITSFDGDDTSLDVGAVYNFADAFGVTGTVRFSDDYTILGLGLRYTF